MRDGLNWYTYTGNNPVRFVDPSGLELVMIDYLITNTDLDVSYEVTETSSFFGLIKSHSVDVTMEGKTITVPYQEVAGHVVVESQELVNNFDVVKGEVEPQAHSYIFRSPDDAAIAWSLMEHERSTDKGHEHAASIYRNKWGYSYGDTTTNRSLDMVTPPPPPEGTVGVGTVHTHTRNDQFSGSRGDLGWVEQNPGQTLYVAGPKTVIRAAAASEQSPVAQERVISTGIQTTPTATKPFAQQLVDAGWHENEASIYASIMAGM